MSVVQLLRLQHLRQSKGRSLFWAAFVRADSVLLLLCIFSKRRQKMNSDHTDATKLDRRDEKFDCCKHNHWCIHVIRFIGNRGKWFCLICFPNARSMKVEFQLLYFQQSPRFLQVLNCKNLGLFFLDCFTKYVFHISMNL